MAAERKGRRRPHRPHARGFSLVEVMVSLVLFSVGVLGVVGLQAKAMQFTAQAQDRSRAALLANELVSQMWHQQSAMPSDEQIALWKGRVTNELPDGAGSVTSSDGLVTVAIEWSRAGTASKAAASSRYVTQVAMP